VCVCVALPSFVDVDVGDAFSVAATPFLHPCPASYVGVFVNVFNAASFAVVRSCTSRMYCA
jgi:hypothetical protein